MTREEVIRKAIEGRITWWQAAEICQVGERQMRRLRERYEHLGIAGLRDGRGGRTMPSRVPKETVEEVCRLRRELYPDFSIRHFHERLTEKHKLRLGETWTRIILQSRGLAPKARKRGQYRRRRERRPMVGMLLHLDASTHTWIRGLPMRDLVVVLDDADGRILYARFVEQEGTASTLDALWHVVTRYGRFCELYTDRGSHFCLTSKAGQAPDAVQNGQVSRVLKALGTRHILARSPEARGRGERAFGTLQGRLPQELRVARVRDYEAANRYLVEHFIADFNRRFAVVPELTESAFVRIAVDASLRLVFSIQHDRVVRNDNTVQFGTLQLQLPPPRDRIHLVRCPVLVHEFTDGTLAVSHRGRLVARFQRDGQLIPSSVSTARHRKAA